MFQLKLIIKQGNSGLRAKYWYHFMISPTKSQIAFVYVSLMIVHIVVFFIPVDDCMEIDLDL